MKTEFIYIKVSVADRLPKAKENKEQSDTLFIIVDNNEQIGFYCHKTKSWQTLSGSKNVTHWLEKKQTSQFIIEETPNIYTLLESIDFEERCVNSAKLFNADNFLFKNSVFAIVQKFYEKIILKK